VAGGGNDAGLVRAAQLGDDAAFSALVERHWHRLVGLARSVVGDVDAEDVVQDTLITAWDRLGDLRDPAAFRAWLTRSVARASVRQARRRAWLRPLGPLDDAADPKVEDRDGEIQVRQLLRRLAPRQRVVMHLTVVEGMSDREIGETIGIDAASVRSHRRRARKVLHRLLPGEGG